MTALTSTAPTATGCGSSQCACMGSGHAASEPAAVPRINGIALHEAGLPTDAQTLREMAYTELLRQQAEQAGLLPRHTGTTAPLLDEAQREVIERMVDAAVQSPLPSAEECQRYYAANPARFMVGQAVHLRHILFAVTPGVNVQALAVRAEKALLELSHKDAPADRFAQLAAELSNCPSSAQGGDLGWVGPEDCAPELTNILFATTQAQSGLGLGLGLGVHPRLVHSRFGFHIIEVLERRTGKTPPYEAVSERIAAQLAMQSRARALHQYMALLVGQAQVEGMALEGADSPLVQ